MQHQAGGDDKGNLQKIGEGLGGLMGQAADSAMGMLGTMMSNMGGWWAQNAQQQGSGGFSASFTTDRDDECRRHFSAQTQASGTRSYDEARPLYQFGHLAGQNPDYQGRSFDQVEMDLQRNWGQEQQTRYGSWPDVRGYVQFGYSGKSASASGSGAGGSTGYQASGSTGGASGGFQASTGSESGGSGGFHASGELKTDGGTAAEFDASSSGSDQGSTSGGFRATGEIKREP